MEGLILIDKPAGWTSFDVVNKVRNLSGIKKVGHAGTLDPFATGLLIVLLGSYTKKQDSFMKQDKTYVVEATLGHTSSTGDPEGELTVVSRAEPALDQVRVVLDRFVGVTQQTPPAHSAVKVGGRRAYDLARQGKAVALEPRTVTIHNITDITYNYPKLAFTTHVSSGTYIRSLVADIGEQLQVGAYTSQLRRTMIGKYSVDDALAMNGLTAERIYDTCRSA